jgi:hypothetical protein
MASASSADETQVRPRVAEYRVELHNAWISIVSQAWGFYPRLAEVAKCRRDHNRLAFAYPFGFVRLFSRVPARQRLELCDKLLSCVTTQLNIDATNIDGSLASWSLSCATPRTASQP